MKEQIGTDLLNDQKTFKIAVSLKKKNLGKLLFISFDYS